MRMRIEYDGPKMSLERESAIRCVVDDCEPVSYEHGADLGDDIRFHVFDIPYVGSSAGVFLETVQRGLPWANVTLE